MNLLYNNSHDIYQYKYYKHYKSLYLNLKGGQLNCQSCQLKSLLSKNNIWMHIGKPCDEKSNGMWRELEIDLKQDQIIDLAKKNLNKIRDCFKHQDQFESIQINDNVTQKPQVLWFSHGSWVYDRFGDYSDHSEHQYIFNNINAFLIQLTDKSRILRIKTKEDLEKFVDKYAEKPLKWRTSAKNMDKISELMKQYICNLVALINENNIGSPVEQQNPTKLYEFFDAFIKKLIYLPSHKDAFMDVYRNCRRDKPSYDNIKLIYDYILANLDSTKIINMISEDELVKNKTDIINLIEKIAQNKELDTSLIPKSELKLGFLNDVFEYIFRNLSLENEINFYKNVALYHPRNYNQIMWNNIKDEKNDKGKQLYFGVAFEFKNVAELGILYPDDTKYRWHRGFDVESLCVWNTKAFDDIVYPVILKVSSAS